MPIAEISILPDSRLAPLYLQAALSAIALVVPFVLDGLRRRRHNDEVWARDVVARQFLCPLVHERLRKLSSVRARSQDLRSITRPDHRYRFTTHDLELTELEKLFIGDLNAGVAQRYAEFLVRLRSYADELANLENSEPLALKDAEGSAFLVSQCDEAAISAEYAGSRLVAMLSV